MKSMVRSGSAHSNKFEMRTMIIVIIIIIIIIMAF